MHASKVDRVQIASPLLYVSCTTMNVHLLLLMPILTPFIMSTVTEKTPLVMMTLTAMAIMTLTAMAMVMVTRVNRRSRRNIAN
jgi:hypothetical protein